MILSRRSFVAGVTALSLAPSGAWAATRLRGAEIVSDIAILREAYETMHPGLYRYNSPARTRDRFEALQRSWSRDQERGQAYLSLSRFLAGIQCGHTYANFYNQSDAVVEELFARRIALPFRFVWIDQRMIVTENMSGDTRLERGAEILEFNGHTPAAILRNLMRYARADGANDEKRRSLLEVSGYDEYETFEVFFSLLFPSERIDLRVRPFGARAAMAVELGRTGRALASETLDRDAPQWTLDWGHPGAARLIMPNWALYNSRWDWRAFLDSAFQQISERDVTRLIVDLRGNEGGLDCGDEIIARLIDADLPLSMNERRVRYRRTLDHLNPYLDTWDDSFRDWGENAIPLADGWYRLRASSESESRVISPKGPRFRGDVVVIIDATNSSATFQFANVLRINGLGTLVGRPTGGNLRGINGGGFFFLRLPASGLECDLPLIGTFPPHPAPNAGLRPDVLVPRLVADIAAGRDAALETARSLGRR